MKIDDDLELVRARLRRVVKPDSATTESLWPTGGDLGWLAERLALTPSEQAVLWVLVAHELCPIARQLIRELNTEHVADPTLDAVRRAAFGSGATQDGWRALGEHGTLRRLGLVERTDGPSDAPEHRQTLKAARRVLALVHGDRALDPDVARFATTVESSPPFAELAVDEESIRRVGSAIDVGLGLVVLRGPVGSGRRSLFAAIAHERGCAVLAIDGRVIATQRDQAERQLRRAARECLLFGLIPLVLHLDALAGSGEVADRFELLEQELHGLVLATTTTAIARRWKRPPITIELAPLGGARRAELWARALPGASPADADLLATMYPLSPALIHAVGISAVAHRGDGEMQPHHIEAGLRSVLDDRLAGLATRIDVTQSWDDLVLPGDQTTAVIELLARIRKRRRVYEDWGFANKVAKGLGVSALFSGPPGTGKTMCAGLIARELGTELYQVDLSKISSKWIGETEKNLAALFDAAEAGHAILLFDEADALFARRTEVRSSNDRHANHEVNYLLQRLESFAGICILTTNHDAAIDEGFRRRLSTHVRFPIPEVEERRRLWRALLPDAAPTANLELSRLAEQFVMTGGYIRNAVLRAAFLAADEDAPITNSHLTRAARLEYEAMGKVVATT
jgi:predicted nucleic acid-binding protein